jgi:5'-nucleotidase
MNIKRPLLLISNDDGYQSKGIQCLVEMLSDVGDIIVCAPDDARSGYSCAFSATIPLRLQKREQREGVEMWSCNGTPVDCVKLALSEICPRKPDMVIGGINHGDNASVNAHYSGTMGVTLEGCMKYIPSVAFSLCDHRENADFEPLCPLIREITQRVLREGLPLGVCLNVNFPLLEDRGYKGVRVCRMAKGTWGQEVTKCHHPRGYDYWWMVGSYTNDEPEAEDTDNWALQHGFIAITPTRMDVTAYEAMDSLKSMLNL